MMNRCKILGVASLVSLLALSMVAGTARAQSTMAVAKKKTTPSKKQPATPPVPDLEPKALQLLKASSDHLAAAHIVSFTAVEIFEHPSRHGHPLAYSTRSDVTDMVAYIDNGVFVQMWIGTEDRLPLMLHAVFLDDPEQLRHELQLSNWQLEVAVPPESFAFANAGSAKRIQFAHPHPQPRPGAKVRAEAKAPNAQQ